MNKTNKENLANAVAKCDDNMNHLKVITNVLGLAKELIKTKRTDGATLLMVWLQIDDLENSLISVYGQMREIGDQLADILESEEKA